jgi:hypothetical protein
MREIGKAAGWPLFEHDERYYVRVESVVSFLSNSAEARQILAAVLNEDLESHEETV